MSNGTPPPAPHVVAVDDNARWLFPLERAPPPSRNEGCNPHGLSDPAPLQSNGSSPPSPPIMSPLPSSHKSSTLAATSPTQTVFAEVRDEMKRIQGEMEAIRVSSLRVMEDMKELRLRQASYQFEETLRRDVTIFRLECLINDETTPEAFLRIKEVNDACAAPLDTILAEIAHDETVHEASRLSTIAAHSSPPSANKKTTPSTPSTETTSSSSTPPRPTYSSTSMGKYTPLTGGEPLTSTPALHASSSIRASTAVTPSPMARRRNRPRRRPGRRHRPRAPEAIPSHPVPPTMGGTIMPTTTHLLSARATAICRSTVSPSAQPFVTHHRTGDVVSTRGRHDFFRDYDKLPRKRPRRRPHARRVCRRHGPCAPNPTGSLCGRRHRPRAPSSSPEAF